MNVVSPPGFMRFHGCNTLQAFTCLLYLGFLIRRNAQVAELADALG